LIYLSIDSIKIRVCLSTRRSSGYSEVNECKWLYSLFLYKYVSDPTDTLIHTLAKSPFYGEHVEHRDDLDAWKYYWEYFINTCQSISHWQYVVWIGLFTVSRTSTRLTSPMTIPSQQLESRNSRLTIGYVRFRLNDYCRLFQRLQQKKGMLKIIAILSSSACTTSTVTIIHLSVG
jgi:hypothetical protein